MRVDFMVIGAQKSGTTGLATWLAGHPQICFSRIKEPGFFNQTEDWENHIDEYHQLYNPLNGQLCGEATTTYTFMPLWHDTSKRLHAYNPDLKLIYIMRQPVSRVVSHYAHNLVRGTENRSPQEAMLGDSLYINCSRYGVQIRPFIELFGRGNVLLLIFEEYVADPSLTLKEIANFLGISENGFQAADAASQHKSVGVPYIRFKTAAKLTQTGAFRSARAFVPEKFRHMIRHRFLSKKLDAVPEFEPELRETIWRFVGDDVAIIEELLGRSLPEWRTGTSV